MKYCIKSFCIILLLLFTTTVYAETNIYVNDLSEPYKTLNYYKIFEGDESGLLHFDENITRAEFCKVVCRALNVNIAEQTEFNMLSFRDVQTDNWFYPYVQKAYSLNLIHGDDRGYFNPDAVILNKDVVKIVVVALGYAELVGNEGYPEGYIKVATEIGLIQDPSNFDINKPAIRDNVAKIINAALDIPLMKDSLVMNGNEGNPYKTLRYNLEIEYSNEYFTNSKK